MPMNSDDSYYTHISASERGLSQRIIIDDFLPDGFPKAASPGSSNLDKPFDHVKYLSIVIGIMFY